MRSYASPPETAPAKDLAPSFRSFLPDLLASLVLLIAALLPFVPALFQDRCILSFDSRAFVPFVAKAPADLASRSANFVTSDLNGWIVPEGKFIADEVQAGRAPLWNPFVLCGQPLLANLAFPPYYFPNWLALRADDLLRAMAAVLVLHFAFAGIGAYFFLRGHQVRIACALFGGIAFQFCAWMTTRIHLPSIVATAAWFPWILVALDSLFSTSHSNPLLKSWLSRTVLLAVAVAGAAFAGFPQVLMIELLGGAVYGALRLFERGCADRGRIALVATGGVALGLLLASNQLLPTLSLLPNSLRREFVTPEAQYGKAMRPAALVGLVLPDFFGNMADREGIPNELAAYYPHQRWLSDDPQENPVENALWPGSAVLLVLLAFGIPLRRRPCGALAVLVLLALLLALQTPLLESMFRHAPWLAASNPKRALLLMCFALPMLAAFGLDARLRGEVDDRGEATRRRFMLFAGGAAGVLLLAGVLFELSPALELGETAAKGLGGFAPFGRHTARQLFEMVGVIGVVLVAFVGLRFAAITRRATALCVVLFLVGGGELVLYAMRSNPLQERAGQYPTTPAIEFLAKAEGRSVRYADHRIAAALLAPYFGYRCLDGGEPMILTRMGELIETIEPGRIDRRDPRVVKGFERLESFEHPAFRRTATPNIVVDRPIVRAGFDVIYDGSGTGEQLGVYRVAGTLPRVRLVGGFDVVTDKPTRLARLCDPSLDPESTVLLETDPGPGFARGAKKVAGNAKIVSEQPTRVEVAIEGLAEPAFLFVADSYDAGWTARVDGESRPVLPADHAFRAVPLPANAKGVVLTYEPHAARLGGLLTMLATGLLLVGFFRSLRRPPS